MGRSTRVRDYMLTKPVTVSPETDLFEAIHLILVNKISGVIVVDARQHLVGVLSELDCLQAILTGTYYQAVGGKVSDYMTREPLDTAAPDDDILAVAQSMLQCKRRRRPVINEDRVVLGQVTCRALLKALKDFDTPEDPREKP